MSKKLTNITKTFSKILLYLSPLLIGEIVEAIIFNILQNHYGPLFTCCGIEQTVNSTSQKIFIISEILISISVLIGYIFAFKSTIRQLKLTDKYKSLWAGLSATIVVLAILSAIWVLDWIIALPISSNINQFLLAYNGPTGNHSLLFLGDDIIMRGMQHDWYIIILPFLTISSLISWPIIAIKNHIKYNKKA